MTAVVSSILPIILYLLALKMLDSFALVKWSKLGLCFGYGIICCALAFLLTSVLGMESEYAGFSIMPLFEEVLKGLLMIYLVSRRKIKFLAEALIYGAAIGGGFSLLENLIYLGYNSDMNATSALFRGFGCAILHIGCTALCGSLMLLILDRIKFTPAIVLSLIPSILIHTIHNLSLLQPEGQLAIVILLFLGVFLIVFRLGEEKIYKWIDHSISTDIQTLSAIKEGNFSATKAGMYLLSVKEQFSPEIFFDMICYVQLYLEAKVNKQSQMLLRQAGFDDAAGSIDEKQFEEKIAELEVLKKNIGKTGYMVLSPLVKDSANILSLSN